MWRQTVSCAVHQWWSQAGIRVGQVGIAGHSTWDISLEAWLGSLRKCLPAFAVHSCEKRLTPSSSHHFNLPTGKGPSVQPSALAKPCALLAAVLVTGCGPARVPRHPSPHMHPRGTSELKRGWCHHRRHLTVQSWPCNHSEPAGAALLDYIFFWKPVFWEQKSGSWSWRLVLIWALLSLYRTSPGPDRHHFVTRALMRVHGNGMGSVLAPWAETPLVPCHASLGASWILSGCGCSKSVLPWQIPFSTYSFPL